MFAVYLKKQSGKVLSMSRRLNLRLMQAVLAGALFTPVCHSAAQQNAAGTAAAQGASGHDSAAAAADTGATPATPQDEEVLAWVDSFARETEVAIQRWVDSRAVTQDKLFSRLYYPIPDTDPTKYHTDYDALADRDLPAIQEKYLRKAGWVVYAVVSDDNGYVPTHNLRYSKPLTQNRALDLAENRTKRIFGDQVGFAAARSEAPRLLQGYDSDSGESFADASAPVRIGGNHWGCVRIGYRRVAK